MARRNTTTTRYPLRTRGGSTTSYGNTGNGHGSSANSKNRSTATHVPKTDYSSSSDNEGEDDFSNGDEDSDASYTAAKTSVAVPKRVLAKRSCCISKRPSTSVSPKQFSPLVYAAAASTDPVNLFGEGTPDPFNFCTMNIKPEPTEMVLVEDNSAPFVKIETDSCDGRSPRSTDAATSGESEIEDIDELFLALQSEPSVARQSTMDIMDFLDSIACAPMTIDL